MQTINFLYETPETLQDICKSTEFLRLQANAKAILVQIFSGVIEKEVCIVLAKAIKNAIPMAQIIGTSATDGILEGKLSVGKIIIAISFFEASTVEVALVSKHTDLTSYQLGQQLGQQLTHPYNKVFIAFGTSSTLHIAEVLQGIEKQNPEIPIAGGSASENYNNQNAFVFTENEASHAAFVMAALRSETLKINRHSHLSFQPIGKEMKITKCSDNQIDTIDDLPILQIYEKYFGNDIQKDFFRKVMSFPLLIKRNGIWLARIPNSKTEAGALRFGADVYEDEIVQFGFGNIDLILATSSNITQKIAKQMPESIFVYSCATRLYFMQKYIELETMPLQNVTTTTGFFTFGEYFYGTNSNEILNMTMTILTLSECPKAKEYTTLLEDTNQIHAENKNEYTEILSLLTHLVNTVTEELKEKNIAIDNSLSQLQESYEEINQMNEELQTTIDLVTSQKEEIEAQRDKIEKHNYDITSSINYAKRIQHAILPSREEIATFLPNNFIFFRPRDVVSGDFYWFGVRGNKIVFAVIDCTGHGVPGAFMTLIANDLLNQIILEKGVCEPNKILNELHIRVRKSLKQSENDVSDGMEIAICTIDKWAKKVQYAGAKMDLYWTQNGECHTTQSDNYPIGGEQREFKREFTLKEIDITAPTTIYMSSDGYKDQFGGRHNKRFMSKNFRNLLFSLVDLPMEVQGEYLDQTITEWMGYHNRQIDDILVVGIKV